MGKDVQEAVDLLERAKPTELVQIGSLHERKRGPAGEHAFGGGTERCRSAQLTLASRAEAQAAKLARTAALSAVGMRSRYLQG